MSGLVVLVCGGRDYADRAKVFAVLDEVQPSIVVHGACGVNGDDVSPKWHSIKGADRFAFEWAWEHAEVIHRAYPAHWTTLRRGAGFIRNHRMLNDQLARGEPIDLVLAFPGGNGTANMIKLAKAAGIPVREET